MGTRLEKAFVSFRIGTPQWMPEDRFRELLALFGRYEGVTDEVTFFTSETHPPLPLDVMRERAALLAGRMASVRCLGYRTGINVLSTIGHHEENLPHSLTGDYTCITGIEGNVCQGSFCPNDERVRDYVEQVYELVAGAAPDYVWIDDDVRLQGHKPVAFGCFCDRCLSLFAEESGVAYTRETLRQAFDSGPVADRLAVRKAWLEHNRGTISRLFALIERTVHGVRPGLPLGFMTGDRFFEGYDFDHWAEILSGPARAEVRWRPGGGFYADHAMRDLTGKSHDVGRQVALLPESVVSVQSEIESFPYQRLLKSAHTTALEAASHVAAGCTGAAFNVLSMYDEPLDEYEPLLAKLRAARPFLDLLGENLGRTDRAGVHTGWGKDTCVAANAHAGRWLEGDFWTMAGSYAAEVFEIGLPAAYAPRAAQVTTLCGESVLALDEERILEILASGVYADMAALNCLHELGYGDLTGFAVDRVVSEDCIEELTDHPLNGPFAGRRRDGRQSFWACPAAALRPLSPESAPLSRMVDYAGKEVASCCTGVFENRLGGRICVAGYYPWKFLQNLSKSSQVKSVMRWLSRDALPAYVASFHKANVWAAQPRPGALSVAVTNASLDPAGDMALMLRTAHEELYLFDVRCAETRIRSCGTDGPYSEFVLPAVGAWEMVLAVAG